MTKGRSHPRRLRRLVETDRRNVNSDNNNARCIQSVVLMVVVSIVSGVLLKETNLRPVQHFISSYRKQFNQIISGQTDYCDHMLDTVSLFHILRHQILHQQRSLLQLEIALQNYSHFVPIAFVGPSGVGKTLTAQTLADYFPWRDNVHTYVWNTYVRDELQKFNVIRMMANQLTDCGINLLIIDNMTPNDRHVLTTLNSLLTAATDQDDIPKKLIVVYIFRLSTFKKGTEIEIQEMELQHLPNVTTINFHPFGVKELTDCIIRDAEQEHIVLTADERKEIESSIDPAYSGCKPVRAKLLLYGKSHNTDNV